MHVSQLKHLTIYFLNTMQTQQRVRDENPSKNWQVLFGVLLILIHLVLALSGIQNRSGAISGMIDVSEFQRQLLISGVFLYLALFACWTLKIVPLSFKSVLGIFLLSFATAILFAADKKTEMNIEELNTARLVALVQTTEKLAVDATGEHRSEIAQAVTTAYKTAFAKDFSSTIYALLIERHAIFVLLIMALVIVSFGMYHLVRSFFKVEYSGAGIQMRLPGHMMYYVPVFPQTSWQNTGIPINEGNEYSIEVSGMVSPGSMSDLPKLKEHMDKLVRLQETGNPGNVELEDAPIWPYTDPFGYDENWYGPGKPNFITSHSLYGQNYYFRKDTCLTIMGLPHCKIVGTIKLDGEEPPRSATLNQRGYNWHSKEDRDELLNLSAKQYPISVTAKKTGELWVVINDVDLARWDNTGLFFLKVTKQAWI